MESHSRQRLPTPFPATSPFGFSLPWLLAYLTMLALIIGGMTYGRARLLGIYGTRDAQVEWDAWREDAKRMAKSGPVTRRAPKSEQPPALVLMTDYFVICLVGSLLLASVLFGTFMILLRGALAQPAPKIHGRPEQRRS